ncbi:MAG: isocitrate lyase/PEP mutase family protein [Rhodospirillaceae bacterium]|nr:isocitrate lyase/PEP mutase family protein [Rhodospirillaceae bacterium]MYF85852.1 isocitrate lyase/PEP mutase family protein [Rhodospirillaceae bacterium]MYH39089.1 isocitrate lyase/PEP mutase family protein [Rhodospirillaceae bacterium]MYK15814.1 isocitrate lyase/PEP mutase family protein [Rhodospirillaceae bacterium]MYK59021.1 isocitrate lyase/PEP mutase family protein [Rhodospirillaceae bacterium]
MTADRKAANAALAGKIRRREWMSMPGVFEMISARVADAMGFDALYMTGYGTVASHLGIPDAGLATYTDMVGRVGQFVGVTGTPLIADGDTGYGGLLNVERTVRGYEAAGAAAIQLEDQEFPKKCGHTPGRRVIPLEDAVAKLRVAAASRASKDFLIVARTDARGLYGLDEALRRGEAFAEAGADILFIESPENEQEMQRIGAAFQGKPLLVNVVEGGSTPVLPVADYRAIGYTMAIYPAAGFLAAGEALRRVYAQIRETGSSIGTSAPLYDFQDFSRLMGFEDVWEFEKKWAEAV